MVLAAEKAGRGSKKVHALVELLKCHTRTRLSAFNRGANPEAGSTPADTVGFGNGVGVEVGEGSVQATSNNALNAKTNWKHNSVRMERIVIRTTMIGNSYSPRTCQMTRKLSRGKDACANIP